MTDDICLNTQWIDKELRLFNENQKISKEFMKTIKITHIYINSSSEIVKTDKSFHIFKDNQNIIHSNEIFKYFTNFRVKDNVKYSLYQLLSYNIDLDDKLYNDINSISTINFMEHITYIKDIIIKPSLFIFHEINAIYIIYKEPNKQTKRFTLKIRRK